MEDDDVVELDDAGDDVESVDEEMTHTDEDYERDADFEAAASMNLEAVFDLEDAVGAAGAFQGVRMNHDPPCNKVNPGYYVCSDPWKLTCIPSCRLKAAAEVLCVCHSKANPYARMRYVMPGQAMASLSECTIRIR